MISPSVAIEQGMYAVMLVVLFISLLAKNVKSSKHLLSLKQYAHSVLLHYPDRSKASEGLICGGSLVLAQVVVTSADCLQHMNFINRITAYFGSALPDRARARLGILSYKIHPKYKENNVVYNLGVVFLAKPPPMGPYIRKIILPVGTWHENLNEEYLVTRLKQTQVTESGLPALVQLEHDKAKKANNWNEQSSSDTQKVISGAITGSKAGRKHLVLSFKEEAFMIVWTKNPALVSSD